MPSARKSIFRSAWLSIALLLVLSGAASAKKFLDAISAADRAILHDLHNGQIVHAEPFKANDNTGSLWKVKVHHEGRDRWAVFKPRTPGDRDGWARTPMEVGMYKLNRILGMDLIPPSAYRRNITLNGQHFAEGALIFWIGDAHTATDVKRHMWRPPPEAFSSDLRILSVLGRDADHENSNNIVRGKHWADGKYRVMKVDNEACMRSGAYVKLEHKSASWGSVTRFNRTTYRRLKELSFDDLKADIGAFVSDGEIRGLLVARDGLVAHIDAEAKRRGDHVFFSGPEISYDSRLRVGRSASGKELANFETRLARKGVRLQYVSPSDPILGQATGQTVLDDKGITVRIARGASPPRLQTLVEEMVHVNQLRTMAKALGGLSVLRSRLDSDRRSARIVHASMEAYAKGKVALCRATKRARRTVLKSQRRFRNAVIRAGGGRNANRAWRVFAGHVK